MFIKANLGHDETPQSSADSVGATIDDRWSIVEGTLYQLTYVA
jgi:hypothetical protein